MDQGMRADKPNGLHTNCMVSWILEWSLILGMLWEHVVSKDILVQQSQFQTILPLKLDYLRWTDGFIDSFICYLRI